MGEVLQVCLSCSSELLGRKDRPWPLELPLGWKLFLETCLRMWLTLGRCGIPDFMDFRKENGFGTGMANRTEGKIFVDG